MSGKGKAKPSIYIAEGRKLFYSKAYLSLSGKATQIYGLLLCRRQFEDQNKGKSTKGKRWVIINNGEIILTYDEAESLGITKKQFRRGIDQLTEKGFIRIIAGYPLKFEFVDNWELYGKDDFVPVRRDKASIFFKKPKTAEERKRFAERFRAEKVFAN